MKTLVKAAVVAFGALGALAMPASAQPNQNGYYNGGIPPGYQGQGYPQQGYQQQIYQQQGYPQQGYGPGYDPGYDQGDADNGYCDPYYGCPDDYADQALYDGEVYYDGSWLNGPFYYRDFGGGRQFWLHGGWHSGNYRGGNFRQAQGRGFYGNHGFAGRSFNTGGNFGGQNYARRAYLPQPGVQPQAFAGRGYRGFAGQPQGFGGGHNWNRQNFAAAQGGGGWRGQAQAQPRAQAQPQAQPRQGGGGGHGGWHHDR